jgi:hypothetical protein
MPIIQPKIVLSESLYKKYLDGEVKIMGLAKTPDTNRIVKHLDVISDGSNATAVTVTLAVAAVTAAVAGITCFVVSRQNKSKVEDFKIKLNEYITAVNNQNLTVEIIDNLIKAMEDLNKSTKKKISIELSKGELGDLMACLCNHSRTLAEANNVKMNINNFDNDRLLTMERLQNNLVFQRELFLKAS